MPSRRWSSLESCRVGEVECLLEPELRLAESVDRPLFVLTRERFGE